jgi:GT2 family glycosyltransferase
MNPLPDVCVVIVNYNGLRFLPECLASVHLAFTRVRAEVIVIDNASTDGSQAWLRTREDIVYIESAENLGFAGGNNLAAKQARAPVLLLLNNDTRIETPLDDLVAAAGMPGTGAVGCRLVYADGRQQSSVGYEHTPARVVLSWLGLERHAWLPSCFRRVVADPRYYEQDRSDVDWVSGACFATPLVRWNELGGFDERFFMYCEDVDYCRRLRERGRAVRYLARPTVTHYEGAGRPWIGAAALQRTVSSYDLFLTKHFGAWRARAALAALASVFVLRSAAFGLKAAMGRGDGDTAVLCDKSVAYSAARRQLWRAAWRP